MKSDPPEEAPNSCAERASNSILTAPYAAFDPRKVPPPNWAVDGVHDDRWIKYFESMVQGWGDLPEGSTEQDDKRRRQERIRMQLGKYVCRSWNRVHGGGEYELRSFEMVIYVKEQTWPDCPAGASGEGMSSVREDKVWEHRCFG